MVDEGARGLESFNKGSFILPTFIPPFEAPDLNSQLTRTRHRRNLHAEFVARAGRSANWRKEFQPEKQD